MRWLPMSRLTGSSVLLGADRFGLSHRAVNFIAKPHSSIAEVAIWTWTAANQLQFRCTSVAYPMATRAADQFRDLCVALVANYPRLLQRPAALDSVTPYVHSELEWTLCRSLNSTTLLVEAFPYPLASLAR